MSLTNPYSYVAPVSSSMFFGRKRELEKLLYSIARGESCALYGGRRIGKTSMLHALRAALLSQADTEMLLLPILINVAGAGIHSPDDFYQVCAEEIARAILKQANRSLDSKAHTTKGLVSARDFEHLCESWQKIVFAERMRHLHIILLLDEFEYLSREAWTADLYASLRALLQQRRTLLSAVLVGSGDFLSRDDSPGSPLANVLLPLRLGVLDDESARALITVPTEGRFSQAVADEVLLQSGAHPFLIQCLMHDLWRYDPELANPGTVQDIAAEFSRDRFEFASWRDALGDQILRVYSVLAQVGQTFSESDMARDAGLPRYECMRAVETLSSYGLVTRLGAGGYRVTGQMFRDWFLGTLSGRLKRAPLYDLYKRTVDFFGKARYSIQDLGPEELLLIPNGSEHPQATYREVYVRLIAGRSATGDDFTAVSRATARRLETDLAHRVALVVGDRRPQDGARYRLYEIRQSSHLAIVPLEVSVFDQVKPTLTANDILADQIDQATGQQNLYAVSGPVNSDLSFFGRERVLQDIADLLNSGQPSGLFGLRKVGKTSLIQRLEGHLAPRRPVFLLDIQGTAQEQGVWPLYPKIIGGFVAYLRNTDPKRRIPELKLHPNSEPASPALADYFLTDLQKLHLAIDCPGPERRLLLIIDEVDRLLLSENAPAYEGYAAFLGQLRAANQQAKVLDFLVSGVSPALNRVERWGDRDNELYRALREMWMPPMDPDDTRTMIESLGAQMGVRFSQDALDPLVCAGGGHPFITRQICSLAVEGRLGKGSITVTAEQAQAAIEEFVLGDNYLAEVWRTRLSVIQREVLCKLARVSRPLSRKKLLPAQQRQSMLDALKGLEDYTILCKADDSYSIAWSAFSDWIRWVELGLEE